MVDDAYVNHIPVLTGGFGKAALRAFSRDSFPACRRISPIRRCPLPSERIRSWMKWLFVSRTQEMPWMLPGIAPTNRRVESHSWPSSNSAMAKSLTNRVYQDLWCRLVAHEMEKMASCFIRFACSGRHIACANRRITSKRHNPIGGNGRNEASRDYCQPESTRSWRRTLGRSSWMRSWRLSSGRASLISEPGQRIKDLVLCCGLASRSASRETGLNQIE